jgi:hypothetical protein
LRAAALAALLLLVGCALATAPLSNTGTAGRDPAKVDADKLACWQAAETSEFGGHSRTRWMVLPVVDNAIDQAANTEALAARDARIERTAEACMQERGYAVMPRR